VNLDVTAARTFRIAAIAEVVTWAGLLVGMFVKHVLGGSSAGVDVFGLVHGIVVLGYVGVALWTASRLGWSNRTLLLALFASVPPGGTIAFERWARRTGQFRRRPALGRAEV